MVGMFKGLLNQGTVVNNGLLKIGLTTSTGKLWNYEMKEQFEKQFGRGEN